MYLKSALKRASSDGEASAPRNVQSYLIVSQLATCDIL